MGMTWTTPGTACTLALLQLGGGGGVRCHEQQEQEERCSRHCWLDACHIVSQAISALLPSRTASVLRAQAAAVAAAAAAVPSSSACHEPPGGTEGAISAPSWPRSRHQREGTLGGARRGGRAAGAGRGVTGGVGWSQLQRKADGCLARGTGPRWAPCIDRPGSHGHCRPLPPRSIHLSSLTPRRLMCILLPPNLSAFLHWTDPR